MLDAAARAQHRRPSALGVTHPRGRAGELALLGVPVFLFQEGADARAETAFREIARLTKGAYCRFDAGSAAQLKDLLSAVAVTAQAASDLPGYPEWAQRAFEHKG